MRNRILIASALTVLLAAACGGSSPATTEEALVGTYNLGTGWMVDGTLSQPIQTMFQEVDQVPNTPHSPSAGAAWSMSFAVGNGGSGVFGSDGIHGTGNLNQITFQMYLVKATPAYFVATTNIVFTDGAGHIAAENGVISVTLSPYDKLQMNWQSGYLTFATFDPQWNYKQYQQVAWSFPAGVLPTIAYSPALFFTLQNSQFYDGCKNDILSYDDNVNDTGHIEVRTLYGTTGAATIPAYVTIPTSQSMCQLQAIHHPELGYDIAQWHVDGI
jgi:hypothetical protein